MRERQKGMYKRKIEKEREWEIEAKEQDWEKDAEEQERDRIEGTRDQNNMEARGKLPTFLYCSLILY